MKSLTRCIYALCFIGFSQLLMANNVEPTVSIRSQKGQSFSIHLKDSSKESYNIKLSDTNGFVLLKEQVEDHDDYMKYFNLKNLPTGEYSLSIETEQKIILQAINILDQQLSIDPSAKKEILKPRIIEKDAYLDLNMIYAEYDNFDIEIRNEHSDVIYNEEVSKKGNFNKRFDLSALAIGDYIIVVSTEYYTFRQAFSIEEDHKVKLVLAKQKSKSRVVKKKGVSKTQKQKLPTSTAAINSKIKWIQSLKN